MKNRFILNDYNIKEVCSKIEEKYPYIKIKIEKSPNINSKSYYLRFYKGRLSVSLRISDHDTNLTSQGGGIRNRIVGKRTQTESVLQSMEQCVHILNWKQKKIRIDKIFKDIDKC